jgi:hypothetical protein
MDDAGENVNDQGEENVVPLPMQDPLNDAENNDELPDPEEDEDDLADVDEVDIAEHDNEASSSISCGMEIIKLILEQHPASIRLYDTQTRSLPIHLILRHNPHASEAIDHFLHLYPKSASLSNGEGRLPIHIALLNNSPSWEQLLELAPETLEKRDPTTGLLPFQIAALSHPDKVLLSNTAKDPPSKDSCAQDVESRELESLSTSYLLLRMNPHLASGLAEAPANPDSIHVVKLEYENKMLRQRIRELEQQVLQMQLVIQNGDGSALKKRKSFNAMDYFSRMGEGM